ncbi:MAG: outer membrane beta-barrel protein [Pseudomonadota bacterium]
MCPLCVHWFESSPLHHFHSSFDEQTGDFGVLGSTQASIDQTAGIFLRGKIPVSNTIEVFSKLGYVSTEIGVTDTVGAATTDYDFSQEGIAFGVGITWLLRGNTGVRFDYTRYNYNVEDVVEVNADGLSIALYHRF